MGSLVTSKEHCVENSGITDVLKCSSDESYCMGQ